MKIEDLKMPPKNDFHQRYKTNTLYCPYIRRISEIRTCCCKNTTFSKKKAWTCYFAFRQYPSWHDTATFEVVNLIIQILHLHQLFLIRLSNSRIVRWNLQNNIWKWPKNITNMKSLKTRFTQPRHVYFSKTSLMYLCTFRRTWK